MEEWVQKRNGTIWWLHTPGQKGKMIFSFDKKTKYNVYQDYKNLTREQKEIFDKENPRLASLFNGYK